MGWNSSNDTSYIMEGATRGRRRGRPLLLHSGRVGGGGVCAAHLLAASGGCSCVALYLHPWSAPPLRPPAPAGGLLRMPIMAAVWSPVPATCARRAWLAAECCASTISEAASPRVRERAPALSCLLSYLTPPLPPMRLPPASPTPCPAVPPAPPPWSELLRLVLTMQVALTRRSAARGGPGVELTA